MKIQQSAAASSFYSDILYAFVILTNNASRHVTHGPQRFSRCLSERISSEEELFLQPTSIHSSTLIFNPKGQNREREKLFLGSRRRSAIWRTLPAKGFFLKRFFSWNLFFFFFSFYWIQKTTSGTSHTRALEVVGMNHGKTYSHVNFMLNSLYCRGGLFETSAIWLGRLGLCFCLLEYKKPNRKNHR